GKSPDWGQVAGAFITSLGIGAMFLAVGVFASSVTSAQVLAGFLTVLLEAALIFGPSLAVEHLPQDHLVVKALEHGYLMRHVQEGALGIIDANHVAYWVRRHPRSLPFRGAAAAVRTGT